MKVTNIKIRRIDDEASKLKAWVDVVLDNNLVVHGMRVVEGKKGLFVSMPNKKAKKSQKFMDIAHFVDKDFATAVEEAVLNLYNSDESEANFEDADETTVTRLTVTKEEGAGNLKAWVNLSLSDTIAIYSAKVIEGKNGLFVAMPSKKSKKGFKDIVHAINNETRLLILNAVLAEYNK